ncbi:MAG: site-2 protease family protein [Anaerolineae bacterium]|nr:site-2 protease family protein [Anaerolineae bacterium]
MGGRSLCIGSFLHIPVRLHATWPVSFLLVAGSLGGAYYPQSYPGWPLALYAALGTATSLLLFASIVLHELAHCVVARRRGVGVHDIVLFVFGGYSQIESEPPSPSVELAMAIAGPLASLAVAAAMSALWLISLRLGLALAAMFGYVAGLNLAVAIFNLIPGFPLDGGRLVRALLWWRSRDLLRATRWASSLGRATACSLVGLGLWRALDGGFVDALWFTLIGCFLHRAARASWHSVAEVGAHLPGLV